MSTVEDFEKAPAVATSYCDDLGLAMKVGDLRSRWVTPDGSYLRDVEMEIWGYRLMSARVALNLAWKLAHPVWEGQTIPKGTRYLKTNASGLAEFVAQYDFKIQPGVVSVVRTLERLPDPEPDWLDAPAVLAVCNDTMARAVFVRRGNDQWKSVLYDVGTADLRDVTPLYPEGGRDA